MTVAGLTCLWYSRYTDRMIKIRYNEYYERKMRSNKVEYSTASGVYCTTHGVKVHFYMLEFSSSKISNNWFHVNNENEYLGIGQEMIICCDMMVQLGLKSYLKFQVL